MRGLDKNLGKVNVWVIVVVVVVLIIAGGVYWWWQSPSTGSGSPLRSERVAPDDSLQEVDEMAGLSADEAGWQTYRNEDQGYEMELPGSWVINGNFFNSPENEEIRNDIKEGKRDGYSYVPNVTVWYYSDIKEAASYKGGSKYISTLEDLVEYESLSEIERVKVANKEAYATIVGGAGAHYAVFIEHSDGSIYEIMFGNKTKSSLTKIDNQILSTFKFIE